MKHIKKWLSAIKRNAFLFLILGFGFFFLTNNDSPLPGSYTQSKSMRSFSDGAISSNSFLGSVASESVSYDMEKSNIMPIPPAYAGDLAPDQPDRMIIKNANLNLEVEHTDNAKALAETEIKKLGGFITNLNSHEVRNNILAYNLTVRVPAEKLDTLLVNLEKLGIKKSENFSSQDITAQYQDTAAQLENLKVRRTRLRKLMEFETKELADVLQVDRELSSLQTQIDRLERTQKGRDEQVSYSTLRLSLNPETQIGDISSPEWNVEKSWKIAVNDLIRESQDLFDKFIRLVVFAPLWIPIVLILWFIKRKFWSPSLSS